MTYADTCVRRPTEYLLREEADLLSPVMVYRLTAKGFDLKDVQAMLALSDLYSTRKIMSRIVGKSVRTCLLYTSPSPRDS